MYNSNNLVLTKEEKEVWKKDNESTKVKSLPKFCPFCKQTIYMTMVHGSQVEVPMAEATFTEEIFRPCIGDNCALWSVWNSCGLCK